MKKQYNIVFKGEIFDNFRMYENDVMKISQVKISIFDSIGQANMMQELLTGRTRLV